MTNNFPFLLTCYYQINPYGTTDQLTEDEIILFRKQKIPTLHETLTLILERNKTMLFDVWPPTDDTHPYFVEWLNVTLEAILDTGVDLDDVVRAWGRCYVACRGRVVKSTGLYFIQLLLSKKYCFTFYFAKQNCVGHQQHQCKLKDTGHYRSSVL